jgi:hypothetical protein
MLGWRIREHARLRQETLRDGGLRSQFGMGDLHGDSAVEREVDGLEHDTHAASAELALEAVLRLRRGREGLRRRGRRRG